MSTRTKGGAAAFGITWLAYASYYLGRKGFSVSKARVVKELAFREETLAAIDTGYLGSYAVGQFLSGFAGDRIGARRLVSAGMLFEAITCATFGAGSSAIALFFAFTMNGLAQSTGWPRHHQGHGRMDHRRNARQRDGAMVHLLPSRRDRATWFCPWLLGRYGWRSTFSLPALCMAAVGALVFVTLKPGPNQPPPSKTSSGSRLARPANSCAIRCFGATGLPHFFIKLIRYSFLFWLPYICIRRLGSTK